MEQDSAETGDLPLRRPATPEDALRTDGIGVLLDSAAFRDALNKERARCDRGGAPFTLMKFELDVPRGSAAHARCAEILAAVLKKRTRLIDAKGWFSECVAVILTNTEPSQTGKIWRAIRDAFQQHVAARDGLAAPSSVTLAHEVYSYPDAPGRSGASEIPRDPAVPGKSR